MTSLLCTTRLVLTTVKGLVVLRQCVLSRQNASVGVPNTLRRHTPNWILRSSQTSADRFSLLRPPFYPYPAAVALGRVAAWFN